MQVEVQGLNGRRLTVLLSFAAFLAGPLASQLTAHHHDCDPLDRVRDYLPGDLEDREDDELAQLVEEASLLACTDTPVAVDVTGLDVKAIRIEEADLPAVKQRLLPNHGLRFVESAGMPLAVA